MNHNKTAAFEGKCPMRAINMLSILVVWIRIWHTTQKHQLSHRNGCWTWKWIIDNKKMCKLYCLCWVAKVRTLRMQALNSEFWATHEDTLARVPPFFPVEMFLLGRLWWEVPRLWTVMNLMPSLCMPYRSEHRYSGLMVLMLNLDSLISSASKHRSRMNRSPACCSTLWSHICSDISTHNYPHTYTFWPYISSDISATENRPRDILTLVGMYFSRLSNLYGRILVAASCGSIELACRSSKCQTLRRIQVTDW